MMRALGGHASGGSKRQRASFLSISIATPARSPCPDVRAFHESFLAGTEPTEACTLHSF